MNRETEVRAGNIPTIEAPRSKFNVEFSHLTTMDAADWVPVFWEEVLPGDTIKLDMSCVVRMSTPLFPTMSNAFLDVMFFYVPNRLLWDHWKEFWGENKNAWYQQQEYTVPQIYSGTVQSENFINPKTVADYMGLPSGIPDIEFNALPFRAYVKCWNDFMRDENLQQEAPMVTTDADAEYDEDYAYLGGALLKANKLHDRFTSCLPSPQKGPATLLPLGSWAPVKTRDVLIGNYEPAAMSIRPIDGTFTNQVFNIKGITQESGSATINEGSSIQSTTEKGIYPNNLWTDLSNATAATVSDLRLAFQIQRYYEQIARSGSRYIEWLKGVFNVTSPDARLQRSEYLGGKRIPIEMTQTVQHSATTETSPLGETGAFSHTADAHEYFTKSFTEHGIIIGCACIRYHHIYQQGIPRAFMRKKWTDYYIPAFAHLSEQPVYVSEIYATGTSADKEIFGYQEAWSEYRMRNNMTSAAMKSTYTTSLDAWHYGDNYESQPYLSAEWIQEDAGNIDRTLAVTSGVENQFIADFYFSGTYVRPMPLYSVPGLIDHL